MSRCMLILGGLVALVTEAGAEEIDRTFEKTFPAPPGTVLHLEHGDGNVEIHPWDREEIRIVVRYRGENKVIGFGAKGEFDVEFEQDGNTVRVIGHEGDAATFGLHYQNIEEYSYTVQSPPHVTLELEGDDGDVVIEGWNADIDIELDDGDLILTSVQASAVSLNLGDGDARLTGIRANLMVGADDGNVTVTESETPKGRFELEDGDLVLKECAGDFDVEVDDGDVRFDRVRVGNGTIRIEDGDVDLGLESNPGLNLDVEASDGDVHLDLQPGMPLEFTVQSESGRLDLDVSEVRGIERDSHRVTGSLHGGGGRVRIRTDAGNISIRELTRTP